MLGRPEELTRGRLLAGNVALNLAGWVLPSALALAAYPVLLRSMGAERFGVLTLAWTVVGTFGVFDLGIGRALTQALAARAAAGDESESPALAWTGVWLLAAVGVLCAVALAAAAPALAEHGLRVSPALRGEAATALRLVALAVPVMVVTAAWRGVLEAGQRFGLINALRVPLALLTFAAPMAVQPFSRRLPAAVATLVVARAVVGLLHGWAAARAYPALRRARAPRRADAAALWRVAGWLTVSAVVSPVLVSADRFVVGALLPAATLAHYATASEVATKMLLFTAALQPVLFSALSVSLAHDPPRAAALFDRAVRVTLLALVPAAGALVLFGGDLLAVWLGAEFARASAPALRWLAIAVLANAVAQVPYAVVQGAGRADVTARLHLLELPLYAGLLWWLGREYGLVGVAGAWLARMAGDGLALLWYAGRVVPAARAAARRAAARGAAAVAVLVACMLPVGLGGRAAAAALAVAAFALAVRADLVAPAEWRALAEALGAWRRRTPGPAASVRGLAVEGDAAPGASSSA